MFHEASVQGYLCGFKGRKSTQQEVPVVFQRPWLPWEGYWFGGFPTAMASLGTPELVLQTVPKAPGGTKEPELQCVPEGRRDALMV